MHSPQYGFFSWNTERPPHLGGVQDFFSNLFQGGGGGLSNIDPALKTGALQTGGGLLQSLLAGRRQAKTQEELALIQQQIALAELQAKQQQAAATRRLIGGLAIASILGLVTIVAVKRLQ